MSRRARPLRKNMLIVCEGEVTEPEYFKILRRIALELTDWDEIEIIPKPPSLIKEENNIKVSSPHKKTRPPRKLNAVEVIDEADEIEKNYNFRQTPVNFVKEARAGLKEDTYIEVWAVFDKDGHPAHQEAFNLSNEPVNGKIVNIAFSSISFEHWILLHFEKNETSFTKSECKQHGKPLECGTGNQLSDCWGERCVSGYFRGCHYMTDSTKKSNADLIEFLVRLFEPESRIVAYENAAWLRWRKRHDLVKCDGKIFQVNPVSTVDNLIKSIFQDEEKIIWGCFGEGIKVNQIIIIIQQLEYGFLAQFINDSPKTHVILPEHFFLSNIESGEMIVNFMFSDGHSNMVVKPGQFEQFYISPGIPLYDLKYLNFQFGTYRVILTQ